MPSLDDVMSTASDNFAPAMLIIGVVALGVLVVIALRARSERDAARREAATGERLDAAQARELHELAGRLEEGIDAKARRLETLVAEARSLIAELEERTARTGRGPGDGTDPLARAVHELADAGQSSVEIARRLDEPVGKIELVLALRRQRGA